jgi:hypothetical protein
VGGDAGTAEISTTSDSIATLAKMRAALKVAHHALTTVHGLWALDGPVHSEMFQLNTLKTIEVIEEALGDAR